MRYALALAVLPFPALAWEFSPDPICTLTHQAQDAEIAITFDASLPAYAIFITLRDGVWANDPAFQMVFHDTPIVIGTNQHRLSADGATLSVRDTGFGNVLDGLENGTSLSALSESRVVFASLSGAAPAVRAFRACPADLPATS